MLASVTLIFVSPPPPGPAERAEQTRWFAEEVQPHEPLVRAYLERRYPSLSDVDDVLQESRLKLLEARHTGRIVSVKAYLFRTATNFARMFYRKRKFLAATPVNEHPELRILEGPADVVETVNAQQEQALVAEAIDQLPAKCREVVVRRVLQGLSHQDIAAELGLAEATVRVQVAKGMKKCTEYLRERGIAEEHRR